MEEEEGTIGALRAAKETLLRLGNVLGIFELRNKEMNKGDELEAKLIDLLIELRQEFRKKKDWATADRIRDGLKELGIVLEDSPEGTIWRRK